MVGHQLQKLKGYLNPSVKYWHLSPGFERHCADGPWPLRVEERLLDGHFRIDKEHCLPYAFRNGQRFNNPSTTAAYALAQWNRFICDSDEVALKCFLRVAQILLEWGEEREGLILQQDSGRQASAMYHGETISVLVRAWKILGDDRYLDRAVRLTTILDINLQAGGLCTCYPGEHSRWYEEWPRSAPLIHALNGHIYTLWGLFDLADCIEDARIRRMIAEGVDALIMALPRFDCGYWSHYGVTEDGSTRIASVMYHALHIRQLQALYIQTKDLRIRETALRFLEYQQSSVCRLRAAQCLIGQRSLSKQSFFPRS